MGGDVVPFHFIKGKTDLSNFYDITQPTRVLNRRERAVYDQLAVDWAELDGLRRKALYVRGCIGELQVQIAQTLRDTSVQILEDLDETFRTYGGKPGPVEKRNYVTGSSDAAPLEQYIAKVLIDDAVTYQRALFQQASGEMLKIATRPVNPPSEEELTPRVVVKRGFWQRLFSDNGTRYELGR
jgi:hypothetical protein